MTLFSTTLSSHSVNASTVACLRRISLNSLKTVKEQEPYFSYWIIYKYGVNYNNMNYSIAIVEKDIACNIHIVIKYSHSAFSSRSDSPPSLVLWSACVPILFRSMLSTSAIIWFTIWASYSTGRAVCWWDKKKGILKFQVQQSNKKGLGLGGGIKTKPLWLNLYN